MIPSNEASRSTEADEAATTTVVDCVVVAAGDVHRCRRCGRVRRAGYRYNCPRPGSPEETPARRRGDAYDDVPCVHRGEVLRTETCEVCGPELGLPVLIRACDVHGECARRKWKHTTERKADGSRMTFCLGCPDQAAQRGS